MRLHNQRTTLSFFLENNTAEMAGSELYGGSIDLCLFENIEQNGFTQYSDSVVFGLVRITKNDSDVSLISSDPEYLCFCTSGTLTRCTNGGLEEYRITAYPGQNFYIEVAAAGQTNGLVPAVFYSALFSPETSHLGPLQEVQEVLTECKNVTYTVYTTEDWESIAVVVSADTKLYKLSSDSRNFDITILKCPPGFWLSPVTRGCTCSPALQPYNITCDINDQTIGRKSLLWIQKHHDSEHDVWGIIVHEHCPLGYCNPDVVKLSLDDPDKQCTIGRSGTLCGSCSQHLSAILGSSKCVQCSNYYLLLLVPFALAGIFLVLTLIFFNLTVSVGTVNGLIFYANIVWFNQSVVFSDWSKLAIPNQFLRVFLAFLNLDLGIETCFYDGMDMYARAWFQFVFPVYIWIIVGGIIFFSRRSSLVVKLCGRNTVSVLATLFILSYAKLLRTVITVLSFTHWKYEDGTLSHAIWLHDGHVRFLAGKHLALSVMALVFWLMFVLPFTLLLVFSPCLQARSGHYILRWPMRYLMPVLDAYQAPFKTKFRYWSGLVLVLRNVLFFSFAVNSLGDPKINFAVIASVGMCLLAATWQLGTVYNKKLINALESFFILNLGILATWSLYDRERGTSDSNQAIITFIMVGSAFVVFVFIVIYHIFVKLKVQECVCWQPKQNIVPVCTIDHEAFPRQPPVVTRTVIELREPLLTES